MLQRLTGGEEVRWLVCLIIIHCRLAAGVNPGADIKYAFSTMPDLFADEFFTPTYIYK
jgi:hypothetical protein